MGSKISKDNGKGKSLLINQSRKLMHVMLPNMLCSYYLIGADDQEYFLIAVPDDEKSCDNVWKDGRLSFRRRKGSSLDRSYKTLPRHLERGKNLSKRFRKSCRNWAASKGLIHKENKDEKIAQEEDNETDDNTDIVVIDLEEDPDLKYKAASETDIGQLVADLVRDAKMNNTLPRTGSRVTVNKEPMGTSRESLTATPVADNEDVTVDVEVIEHASPSTSGTNETAADEVEDEVAEEDNKDCDTESESNKSEVLETCFDEVGPDAECLESVGESFYNGINLGTEFLVTASYSKELFKEETTSSLETSELDQVGYTDVAKVNMSANENDEHLVEKDAAETEHSDTIMDKFNVFETVTEAVSDKNMENVEEEAELINRTIEFKAVPEIQDLEEPATDTLISFSHVQNEVEDMVKERESEPDEGPGSNVNLDVKDSQETENKNDQENSVIDLHAEDSLQDDSENEFESIAKISALDFLNDDDEEDDNEDEVIASVTNNNSNYFSSSFMFNHPAFSKDNKFSSLNLDLGKEDNPSSSYLEAINLEHVENKEGQWMMNQNFRFSSVELRINPMYKDEDSLNSNNSLIMPEHNKSQQHLNYNFQEFFDIWERFAKNEDDDHEEEEEENTFTNIQDSPCSLIFNNLEAIQEEDESEEGFEVDENNNYGDYDTDEDEEIVKAASEHDNTVMDHDGENHDLNIAEHEKIAEITSECCNSLCEYLDIFNIESDIFETKTTQMTETEESLEIEKFIEDLVMSLVQKILEPCKEIDDDDASVADEIEIDDEYYSCDSPDDLHSEPGSGISTDEGIEATDDDDDDLHNKKENYKPIQLHEEKRKTPTQL